MSDQIVVALRMPPAGMTPGDDGPYLTRARSACARGEALGGRLVAWSAVTFAMAWDTDSIEEAVHFAAAIREGTVLPERTWACGIAEGEIEPLAPDGQRMHLAWGRALNSAVSLARIAMAGEVLVDGDVRALRSKELAIKGARSSTDSGRRVHGWRLDLDRPWTGSDGASQSGALDARTDAPGDGLSAQEVLEIVERASRPPPGDEDEPPSSERPSHAILAERMRALVGKDSSGKAAEMLADLRRGKLRAEQRPAAEKCHVSLALSMTLSIAGHPEEALLEALDALARAREASDTKAAGACFALLAKLYGAAGLGDAADILVRDAANWRAAST